MNWTRSFWFSLSTQDGVLLRDERCDNVSPSTCREKNLQERLEGVRQKKENKSREMNDINSALAQQAASEYNNDATAKAL